MKPYKTEKQAIRLLCASIENERRVFNMSEFTVGSDESCTPPERATCNTASCIAGHIEAVFHQTARALEKDYTDSAGDIHHDRFAAAIWERVTGKPCRFDFFGVERDKSGFHFERWPCLADITREDAIQHIKGKHPLWPLANQ